MVKLWANRHSGMLDQFREKVEFRYMEAICHLAILVQKCFTIAGKTHYVVRERNAARWCRRITRQSRHIRVTVESS